jgi:hypothetical protein
VIDGQTVRVPNRKALREFCRAVELRESGLSWHELAERLEEELAKEESRPMLDEHPAKRIGWTPGTLPTLLPNGSGILSKSRTTTTLRLMTTILTSSIPVPFRFNRLMNLTGGAKIAPPRLTGSLRWGTGWGTPHAKPRNATNQQNERTP